MADRPVFWLYGKVKSPPFTDEARKEAGDLIRAVQRGETLSLPHSRPMPSIGARVHELRIVDASHNWRILYRTDPDAVLIVEVFDKKTQETPRQIIENCKRRLAMYDSD